jgi:hypothetical protein
LAGTLIMTVPSLAIQIQGQGTVSADNLNTYIQTAQTANQLRTLVGLPGMSANLQGISIPGDGNGGFFYWNSSGTEPDDNFNYIVPIGYTTGEWVRYTIAPTSGMSTYSSYSIDSSVTAAGSTQSTSTLLISQINVVTSVPSGTGVQLQLFNGMGVQLPFGTPITIYNRGLNILSVYPPNGQEIESLGSNNPAGIAINGDATYTQINISQWLVS